MERLPEKDFIRKIISCFPKSALHKNEFFESDSEVFEFQNNRMLFSTDNFSSEDLFREVHPRQFGRNLAIATISDIFAAGGIPLFYGHSMVVSKSWHEPFVVELSKGIAEILKAVDANFLGGDFGISYNWQYTGIVIGEVVKPLSRIGASVGDSIYFTGKAGAGNLEAALSLYSNKAVIGRLLGSYTTKFYSRFEEAKIIRDFASACIDTSDGVFNGISTIASLNDCGFSLENVPILSDALLAAKLLGKPAELLLLGECGEYELLFTVPTNKEEAFVREITSQSLDIHKIGTICESNIKKMAVGKNVLKLNDLDISARAFGSTKEYLAVLVDYIRNS